jgi:hypothetical protein
MKKALMIFGAVFIVLVVVVVIGIAFVATKGSALDKESKAYVDEVLPAICSDLRMETLSRYASQDLLNSALPAEFEKVFNGFKKLGVFKKYKESSGQANMFYSVQHGETITGKYIAQVEFDSGPAQIQVTTVKRGDQWKIQGFVINSPALMQ